MLLPALLQHKFMDPLHTFYLQFSGRLVFHCLLELARCRAKGVVEAAVLLGATVGVTPERWTLARSVVAGRLINGHSSQDWVRPAPDLAMPAVVRTISG